MKTDNPYQLFVKSMALVLVLSIFFSSTFSSVNILLDFETIELLDLADKDSEEEKKEQEKDNKIEGNQTAPEFLKDQKSLSIAENMFLRSHQFGENSTPPPEFLI